MQKYFKMFCYVDEKEFSITLLSNVKLAVYEFILDETVAFGRCRERDFFRYALYYT